MESANALAGADDPMIRTYTRRFLRSLPPPHTRDVVDRLGFAASSAFSRWFRRRFGISPTAQREATIGSAIPT
jgi:AraC-like DNA-binding protein